MGGKSKNGGVQQRGGGNCFLEKVRFFSHVGVGVEKSQACNKSRIKGLKKKWRRHVKT